MKTPTHKFPIPDYDAGICTAGPSIGYTRDLSPVEIREAFAANPDAMHVEMPGGYAERGAKKTKTARANRSARSTNIAKL